MNDMTPTDSAWLFWLLVSLAAALVCLLVAAFALALAHHYRTQAELKCTAFEESEADVENVVAWQKRALDFLRRHAPALAEAEGLVRRAPLIIGGREVETLAVYLVYEEKES